MNLYIIVSCSPCFWLFLLRFFTLTQIKNYFFEHLVWAGVNSVQCTVRPILTIKNLTESGQRRGPNYLITITITILSPWTKTCLLPELWRYHIYISYFMYVFSDRENLWCALIRTSNDKNYYILLLK